MSYWCGDCKVYLDIEKEEVVETTLDVLQGTTTGYDLICVHCGNNQVREKDLPAEFVYQRYIRQLCVSRMRCGIYGKPGCGKTRPVIDATVELGRINPLGNTGDEKFPFGPILVLCTGPAIATWKRQFPLWADDDDLKYYIHVVRGTKKQRMDTWNFARTRKRGIFITNYSVFHHDFAGIFQVEWAEAIADEYHRCMLRKTSQTYKEWQRLTRHIKVLFPLTGSAIRKNPSSMFTLFQMIAPKMKTFRSYWRFVNTYCLVTDGHYSKEIGGPKNLETFKALTDKYIAYVPAEVVNDNLPEGFRVTMHAEMTESQSRIYHDLAEDMIAETEHAMIVAPTAISKVLKLRQLLCCPKILDPSLDMGGGFERILDHMLEEPHCVIFVPFRLACEYVVEALQAKGYHAEFLRGGVDDVEQAEILDRLRKKRGVLVCTIAYAESFDYETCRVSYFLGYEYVLSQNEQAEGRTQRAISKSDSVTWHYLKYLNTVDEYFLAELGADLRNVQRMLSRPESFIAALRGESDEH